MVGWKILKNSTHFHEFNPGQVTHPQKSQRGSHLLNSRNGQHQLSPIPLHCCSEDAPDFWELGPSWSVCSEDAPDFWQLGPSWSVCSEDAPDFWQLGPSWSVCSEDAPDFWQLGPSWSFSSLGEWRYLEEPPDFWELGPEDAAEACRESQFREAAISHLHRVFCWCILCLSLFCSILH